MANGDDQGGGFTGLLGNPLFNVGIGLLSASGPSATPTSFGQRLAQGVQAGNQLQRGFLKTQAAREKLAERAQRREASRELGELFQPGTNVNTGVLPTGEDIISGLDTSPGRLLFEGGGVQAGIDVGDLSGAVQQIPMQGLQEAGGLQSPQVMGLLSEAAPEQFTQGLLNQAFPSQRSETSLVRNVRALNDPTLSPEQRDILRRNLEADPNITDQQLRTLELQQRQFELARELEEARREDKTQRQKRGELITSLRGDLNKAVELANLNDKLAGTALETGVPLADLRRAAASGGSALARLAGVDTSKAEELVADFDRFSKLSTDFATQSATRLFDQGRLTNLQLQSIQDAQVSPTVAPDANRRVIADNVEQLLKGADNAGIEIKDRKRFESLIQELRGREQQGGQVPEFSSEQEANAALQRGQIQVGDEVIVNGRRFRVEE